MVSDLDIWRTAMTQGEAMRYLPTAIAVAFALAGPCATPSSAQKPANPQPVSTAPFTNPAIPATMTCSELLPMLHATDKKSGGVAMLWLDGYYSARADLTEMPADWAKTVSQGIGATCNIAANASRTVLDVIDQLHREYGAAPAAKP
jgi:hypothetical protein